MLGKRLEVEQCISMINGKEDVFDRTLQPLYEKCVLNNDIA